MAVDKQVKTVVFRGALVDRIQAQAKKQNRSFTNMVNVLVLEQLDVSDRTRTSDRIRANGSSSE